MSRLPAKPGKIRASAIKLYAHFVALVAAVLVLSSQNVHIHADVSLSSEVSALYAKSPTQPAFVDGFVPWPRDEPLFLVYGHIERFWGDHVAKSFMWIVHNLTLSRGWQRILVGYLEHETPDLNFLGELILAHYGRPADVLLFLQDYDYLQPRYPNHTMYDTTIMCLWDDTHRLEEAAAKLATADVWLNTYVYLLDRYLPDNRHRPKIWLPHSAMPAFMRPFNDTPRADAVLLVGYLHDPYLYPIRAHIHGMLTDGDPRLHLFKHPGWHPVKMDHQADMAIAMAGYLAAITDCSKINYVVGKTFEIPATGALMLMSDDIQEPMVRLGFLDGVNYKTYNLRNINATLDWVLDPSNRAEVDRIRRAGQELVAARHQTQHRAELIHDTAAAVFKQGGRKKKREWVLPQPFLARVEQPSVFQLP